MMELDRTVGFRILHFDDAAAQRYVELLPGSGMAVVKGGTYQSMPEDARVPYVFNQMVSGTRVPDDLVYKVTKLMNEHAKDFHGLFPGSEEIQTRTALDYNKLPIHPGAERYYREIGLIK
jgi:TRAP-type uncharacterized transport system substrate-binding protein